MDSQSSSLGPETVAVSIIICTYNRAESLRQTLASLAHCIIPPGLPAELLVIDNGSTDGTRETVRDAAPPNLPTRYVLEPQRGQVHARHAGLREGRGFIFLFTDDDVRIPVNWIEGMCRPIFDKQADAVAGGVVLASELERAWMSEVHRGYLACPTKVTHLIGANMAFGRHVLQRIHCFDSQLGPGSDTGLADDTIFSDSLVRAGYRVVVLERITVEHHPPSSRLSRSSYLAMATRVGRTIGYLAYHREHADISICRIRIAKHRLVLFLLQMLRQPKRITEGVPAWELARVQIIYTLIQYAEERGTTPRYDANGLLVLNGRISE